MARTQATSINLSIPSRLRSGSNTRTAFQHYDELKIDRRNFNDTGNNFSMTYGFHGDRDRTEWLSYEYRITWNLFGGAKWESGWKTTDDFIIPVTPPHRYREVTVEADSSVLFDAGVRLASLKFKYNLFGNNAVEEVTIRPGNNGTLSQVIRYAHEPNDYEYDYDISWLKRGGMQLEKTNQTGNAEFLFADELPESGAMNFRVPITELTVIILAVVCLSTVAEAQDQPYIHFAPSNWSEGNPLQRITEQGDFAQICNEANGLPGLDRVRDFAGRPTCERDSENTSMFIGQVDLIVLIDDTSPLSDDLVSALRLVGLLSEHEGRPIVQSGVRDFQQGQATPLNILVVGEMEYRLLGGDEELWLTAVTRGTGAGMCQLPDRDMQDIRAYADQVHSINGAIRSNLLNALANFESRVSSGSTADARADIGGALLSTALKQSVDIVAGFASVGIPGTELNLPVGRFVVGLVRSAMDEAERARAAGRSQSMAQWTIDARRIISNCVGNVRCDADDQGTVGVLSPALIAEELQGSICRLTENRREAGMAALRTAHQNSLSARVPEPSLYAKYLYESFINSHFDREAERQVREFDSAQGTIEVVWPVSGSGDQLRFDTASHSANVIIADYGDNIDDGLNDVISNIGGVDQIWDFAVHKRVCFLVRRATGGRARPCYLLGPDNRLQRRPGAQSLSTSRDAFEEGTWRRETNRLRSN